MTIIEYGGRHCLLSYKPYGNWRLAIKVIDPEQDVVLGMATANHPCVVDHFPPEVVLVVPDGCPYPGEDKGALPGILAALERSGIIVSTPQEFTVPQGWTARVCYRGPNYTGEL